MDIVITLLQILAVICLTAFFIERARERKRQRELERQAGDFLISQIAEAPEKAIIILGPATYRTKETIKILHDGIKIIGTPGNKILGEEGIDSLISVEGVNGIEISGLHLESLGPSPVIQTVTEQDLLDECLTLMEDVKIIINDDNLPIDEIMRREYEMGGNAI